MDCSRQRREKDFWGDKGKIGRRIVGQNGGSEKGETEREGKDRLTCPHFSYL